MQKKIFEYRKRQIKIKKKLVTYSIFQQTVKTIDFISLYMQLLLKLQRASDTSGLRHWQTAYCIARNMFFT